MDYPESASNSNSTATTRSSAGSMRAVVVPIDDVGAGFHFGIAVDLCLPQLRDDLFRRMTLPAQRSCSIRFSSKPLHSLMMAGLVLGGKVTWILPRRQIETYRQKSLLRKKYGVFGGDSYWVTTR